MFDTCNTIANIEIATIANIATACETIRNARKGRRCLVLRKLHACKVTCNTCASVYDVCETAAHRAARKAEYAEGMRYYRTGEGYANFYCNNYSRGAGMKTYNVRTDCAAYTQCETGSLPPRAPRAGKARFSTATEIEQHDAWFRSLCERTAASKCTVSARYTRNARRRELYRLHKTAQEAWARSCTEWREMVYTLATAKPVHRGFMLHEMTPRLREGCKVGRDAEGAQQCYEARLALLRGIAHNDLTIPQARRVHTLCERFEQCRA